MLQPPESAKVLICCHDSGNDSILLITPSSPGNHRHHVGAIGQDEHLNILLTVTCLYRRQELGLEAYPCRLRRDGPHSYGMPRSATAINPKMYSSLHDL